MMPILLKILFCFNDFAKIYTFENCNHHWCINYNDDVNNLTATWTTTATCWH